MRTPRSIRRTAAATALVGALAIGAMVPALAQDDATVEDDTTADEERAAAHEARHLAFAEALADELDLAVDDVSAALEAVRDRLEDDRRAAARAALEERLSAAVDDGDLTQEQADAILDAHEAGVFPGRGGWHGHGKRGAPDLRG